MVSRPTRRSTLSSTKTPATLSYDEFVEALKARFRPRPPELYKRTFLQHRDQLPGELVSAYTVTLRELPADCLFGTPDTATRLYGNSTMVLVVVMRDRFVSKLRDAHIQQRPFAQQDVCFETAHNSAFRADGAVKRQ